MRGALTSAPFELVSELEPRGDQPAAIEELVAGFRAGLPSQVLLGVTGSGKTFTMAHVIARLGRPALVIAPNKTLAAQLYAELRDLFPRNAVEYFVSYYDYYQPEAYVPSTDTYIEKDASINDEIDKLRRSATRSVLTRRDVIVVASVSCIYGIGDPEAYREMLVDVSVGDELPRDQVLRRFVGMQYVRNDVDFHRGTFRVRGDVVEIFPAYESDQAVRIEFFGDTVERVSRIDALRGSTLERLDAVSIFPGGTNSSRLNASKVVSSTTSKCSARWVTAPGSRTIRVTSTDAAPECRLRPCWTTFPTTSCCWRTRAT